MTIAKPIYVLNGVDLNPWRGRRAGPSDLQKAAGFSSIYHESRLGGPLQHAKDKALALVLHADALTQTALARHDAALTIDLPVIEALLTVSPGRAASRAPSTIASPAPGAAAGFVGSAGAPA